MPFGAFLLRFAEGADVLVGRGAFRALRHLAIYLVQAALVEGVFAEEVDRGQVQRASAGRAPTRLEDGGFGAQIRDFLSLGFGFGAVAFDEAPILDTGR